MAAPYQDCIVLFGDSITSQQGEPGNMQARFCANYRRTLDTLNRGFGGYNTDQARQLVDVIFAKTSTSNVPTIRLVTLFFGANDAVLPGETDQHVPLTRYVENLRYILDQFTNPTSPYLLAHEEGLNIAVVTPPPIYPDMMDDPVFRRQRAPEVTKMYAEAVRTVFNEFKAKETKASTWRIGLVDMWDATLGRAGGQGEGLRQFLSDGLHLTSDGYQVFWDEYTRLIQTTFQGRGLDFNDLQDLPLRVPSWENVDFSNPASVLNMRLPPIRSRSIRSQRAAP